MANLATSNFAYQNFYSSRLTSDITAVATTIYLDTVPSITEGIVVIDPDAASPEVVFFNAKGSTYITIPSGGRGYDDTTATTHNSGTEVIIAPVAAYFSNLQSLFTTTPQGWTSFSTSLTGGVYNGNRSYTFNTSTDPTSVISNGMRLRTTRTVTAPTQCTSLNGTTQYYSKATPAGMTFTDDFVAGAWVKLSSYPAAGQTILSRYNGTSGWSLQISTSGQLQLVGFNAGAANISYGQSYQSVPLNKWVHVAGQLDMSTFTATATTTYFMIDGVDVPTSVSRGGTNPTALVQAGNLEVGSQNGGLLPFSGKIAQAFVTSAKVTQANVRAIYSQGLTSADMATYSIISAYSFNGVKTDINTTNANNLTANGSAVETNADSPFTQNASGTPTGTSDYAIVTGITSTTITCQVPEGCTIPTSGGVSAVSYSGVKAPYGFPVDRGKWQVVSLIRGNTSTQATPVVGTWYNPSSQQLNIPVGSWNTAYQAPTRPINSTNLPQQYTSLSTAASSETDVDFTSFTATTQASANPNVISVTIGKALVLSSATTYYLICKTGQAATNSIGFSADVQNTYITAELATL